MALVNHESALIEASVNDIWNLLSPLDFKKLQPALVESCTTNDSPQVTVGSQRMVTFKSGDVWHLKMKSYCEDTHLITWELFQAEPAITYSSRVDTIQLRRVTTTKHTLLQWTTRFSGDATTEVLEDCKYKKRETFRDLRKSLTTTRGADVLACRGDLVWKFGYGSNMSLASLRKMKNLNPMEARRTALKGFALSFPKGAGIPFVEPAFATIRHTPNGQVHGVAALMSRADAESLDRQEGLKAGTGKSPVYTLELVDVTSYEGETMRVEVYAPSRTRTLVQDPCSDRYRAILVAGAVENNLDPKWITKLKNLPVYEPSAETLAARKALPSPGEMPVMTIAELAPHNGKSADHPCMTSVCGYIFQIKVPFVAMRGRDVTYRNAIHRRGLSASKHDDGGVSPFPRLSQMAPEEREYALRYRDFFTAKCKKPVAVLKEFWEEQETEVEGLFSGNTLSKL